MARCSTAHGPFRCDREAGHSGECETECGPRAPLAPVSRDLDSRRELRRAAQRIVELEQALEEIRTSPCDATDGRSCLCCLFDRTVAAGVLRSSSS